MAFIDFCFRLIEFQFDVCVFFLCCTTGCHAFMHIGFIGGPCSFKVIWEVAHLLAAIILFRGYSLRGLNTRPLCYGSGVRFKAPA